MLSRFLKRPSLIVCCLYLLVTVYINKDLERYRTEWAITFDIAGYYIYLPAVFIHNDLAELDFRKEMEAKHWGPATGKHAYHEVPETGNTLVKYPGGVALFQLPAFLVAHGIAHIDKAQTPDGYSEPYWMSIWISTVLWTFLGLLLLRGFLLRYFHETDVGIALLIIAFGTNLYYYSTYEAGMSHNYLFFLYAAVLWLTERWYRHPRYDYSILLGLCLGWAVFTRPTDLFLSFIPLLWGLNKPKATWALWKKHAPKLLLSISAALLPISLQLGHWKLVTDNWIYYSYRGEGFSFDDPKIWKGLFSYRKGWFVYTPLALLGFIAIPLLWRNAKLRFYLLPFSVYYLLSWYVLFSWGSWVYGGSFGCRALIQSYALLGIPFAALSHWVRQRVWPIQGLYILILYAGILLNQFQTWQYSKQIIHWDSMNEAYYWRIFGETEVSEADKKLLEKE